MLWPVCYNAREDCETKVFTMAEQTQEIKSIGRYIVANPNVCHGQLTFRGTRIFVADVLDQVASGMAWETIIEEWHDSLSKEAIAEAVQLSAQALLKHADEFTLEPA